MLRQRAASGGAALVAFAFPLPFFDRGFWQIYGYSSTSLQLELPTAAAWPTGATLAHGGFAEPRIVTPGDAAPPSASPR